MLRVHRLNKSFYTKETTHTWVHTPGHAFTNFILAIFEPRPVQNKKCMTVLSWTWGFNRWPWLHAGSPRCLGSSNCKMRLRQDLADNENWHFAQDNPRKIASINTSINESLPWPKTASGTLSEKVTYCPVSTTTHNGLIPLLPSTFHFRSSCNFFFLFHTFYFTILQLSWDLWNALSVLSYFVFPAQVNWQILRFEKWA